MSEESKRMEYVSVRRRRRNDQEWWEVMTWLGELISPQDLEAIGLPLNYHLTYADRLTAEMAARPVEEAMRMNDDDNRISKTLARKSNK